MAARPSQVTEETARPERRSTIRLALQKPAIASAVGSTSERNRSIASSTRPGSVCSQVQRTQVLSVVRWSR